MPAAATIDEADRRVLLSIARGSIREGLASGRAMAVGLDDLSPRLRERGASFVTIRLPGGQLRGCIGSLEAYRALAVDVAQNAHASAFRDPRFGPLRGEEEAGLRLHLSVLTPALPLPADGLDDLLAKLRPGEDGLIVEEGGEAEPGRWGRRCRATFLPAVWQTLADPRKFVDHLWMKADLPVGHWSPSLRLWRYGAEEWGE